MEALWFHGQCFTYVDLHKRACQFANLLISFGIKPGEKVALYMQNSPEILTAWLGIWSIGACPAFINYNLTGGALLHTWKLARSDVLIADHDLASNLIDLRATLGISQIVQILDANFLQSLYALPVDVPDTALAATAKLKDDCILMYTR